MGAEEQIRRTVSGRVFSGKSGRRTRVFFRFRASIAVLGRGEGFLLGDSLTEFAPSVFEDVFWSQKKAMTFLAGKVEVLRELVSSEINPVFLEC